MSTLSNQPAAAADLLNAKQQLQFLQTRACLLARPRTKRTEANSAALQVVEFLVGTEHYALEASVLPEVFRTKEVIRIPGTPPYVLGVINVRELIVALERTSSLLSKTQRPSFSARNGLGATWWGPEVTGRNG
jgi:hypothetical protein